MPEPTNSDIIGEIRANHAEVTVRLGAVEKQVRKTNGRVATLETWKSKSDAVAEYKANQPVVQNAETVNIKTKWYETPEGRQIFLAVAGLITALAGVIALRGGI